MNEPILSRAAITEDADRAAQRYAACHVDQPNPHTEGTEAFEIWRAHYARMCAFYLDPTAEASA